MASESTCYHISHDPATQSEIDELFAENKETVDNYLDENHSPAKQKGIKDRSLEFITFFKPGLVAQILEGDCLVWDNIPREEMAEAAVCLVTHDEKNGFVIRDQWVSPEGETGEAAAYKAMIDSLKASYSTGEGGFAKKVRFTGDRHKVAGTNKPEASGSGK